MKVGNLLFSGPMILRLRDEIDPKIETRRLAKPRWEAGDLLWVRETWGCHFVTNDQKPRDIDPEWWSVFYAADGEIRPAAKDGSQALRSQITRLRPSIFMPRWASRITLEVVEVRFEPLSALQEEDAMAEGIFMRVAEELPGYRVPTFFYPGGPEEGFVSSTAAYIHLWDSINGEKAPAKSDPMVWVTRFKRPILENVDAYLKRSGLAA